MASAPRLTTPQLTAEEAQAQRKWFVVDLEGQTLGRAATKIAHVLRGKHKPSYTPHVDDGDFVVVINASKVKLTGNKLQGKNYYDHSLYMGGLLVTSAEEMLAKKPEELIKRAVWGMLPKGPLGRRMHRKLKVFPGAEHKHEAQKPEALGL